MGFICDKQPELRQAAAYGVGVMAKFGGDVYASTCAGNITKWWIILKIIAPKKGLWGYFKGGARRMAIMVPGWHT